MKSYTLLCFFLLLAMILCPLVSVEKTAGAFSGELFGEETASEEERFEAPPPSTVKVMSAESKNITEITLKEYLIGAVAAEISPSYHEEAIKAQAVASHTMLEFSKRKNRTDGADITDDSMTAQGYISAAEQREKWGDSYEKYREKIEKCVDEVSDLLIFYDGEIITPAFHAISGGSTENAAEVWGGDYPYLVSAESPGDRLSPSYSSELTVSPEDFKNKAEANGARLSDKPEEWIGESIKTAAGAVKTVSIGGKDFKGSEVRKMFSLRSSNFTCKYSEGSFVFAVCGYGHGVGMSQYGADFMARQGCTYTEILKHYYKSVEIK